MNVKRRKNSASAAVRKIVRADMEKELARERLVHEKTIAKIKRLSRSRETNFKTALKNFRPRKSERGRIVFVGKKGGRLPAGTDRRGYGVYVTTTGKKQIVRQLTRDKLHVEKIPAARKLSSLDISRVRSKKAKREFFAARINPVAARELRKKSKHVTQRGTRYGGELATDKFYKNADSVDIISRELIEAVNGRKSRRDFLVTIGFSLIDKDGKRHWLEIQRRFVRADKQPATEAEARAFLSREVYAFLARELTMRGLVLAGSAAHIRRLKQNEGLERDEWTKGGFLWEGHDSLDCKIDKIEYRFDQLILTK